MNLDNARIDAVIALMKNDDFGSLPLLDSAVDLLEELVRVGRGSDALKLVDQVERHSSRVPPEAAARLIVAKITALLAEGRYSEAYEQVRVHSDGDPQLHQGTALGDRLLILHGTCLWMLNKAEAGVELLSALRARLLRSPDSRALATCTIQLSAAHWILGNYNSGRQLALDALISARRIADHYVCGQALISYSRQARQLCRWGEALEAAEEAKQLFIEIGNEQQLSHALRALALIHWKRGHLPEALQLSDEVIGQSGQNVILRSIAWLVKTVVLIHWGRYEEADQLARAVPGWDVIRGQSRGAVLAAEYVGDILLERGDVNGAFGQFEKAFTETLAIAPNGDLVGDLVCRRAYCLLLLNQPDNAYQEGLRGLRHWRTLGDRYEEAATYRILALSAAAVGKPDEAKAWFDQGFALYDEIETPYEWGKLWMAYGDWLTGPHAGAYADRRGALEAYHAARDHFERMGAEAKLKQANERIAGMMQAMDGADVRHTPRRPRRSTELERRSAWAFETFKIVTRDRPVLALLDDVAKLAVSQTPMLVLGESGTGKELIARGIHALSGRKGPFMAINAGSLPREIIESELFGHMAGSFTGASRDKPGIFEVCDKGTVFLDEIAEMSVDLQSRLLRFLETGESRRVGSNVNIAVDTRIIAATNRDRGALERGDGFRVDLYYRLAHAVITLPPLRHRGDDIDMLAEHFLEEACTASRKDIRLSPAAVRRMAAYSWPGNVRQLRALIKRVVLLGADGHEVSPDELQLENAEVPTTLIQELEQAERRRVGEALAQARGSRTEAARLLGMPRTTLINKIKRYGLV